MDVVSSMVRDILIVTVILAGTAGACIVLVDRYQSPPVSRGSVVPAAPKLPGDFDPKKASDPVKGPQPAEVLLFTALRPYTQWYVTRDRQPGFDLTPPETVDFDSKQIVAILWGDKPSGGYELALKSVADEENATLITIETKIPHGSVDPTPESLGVAVAVPNGKRVRVVITGDRFRDRNGFTDFKESRTLECDVMIRGDRKPNE
jgi:hypothetical protein